MSQYWIFVINIKAIKNKTFWEELSDYFLYKM